MKYYLVKESTYFYDAHGTPDSGGTSKYVMEADETSGITIDGTYIDYHSYSNYLDNKYYDSDQDENEDEYDFEFYLKPDDYNKIMDFYAQDSYNCEQTELDIKEITKEEYNRYEKIINEYDKI